MSRAHEKTFRIVAGLFAVAAVYHAIALAIPAFDEIAYPAAYPLWRHVLFIAIDTAFAWLLLERPGWLIWPYSVLTIQVVFSHGGAALSSWQNDGRLDWMSIALVMAVICGFAQVYSDRRGHALPILPTLGWMMLGAVVLFGAGPLFCLLVIAIALATYAAALLVRRRRSRPVLAAAVVVNILAFAVLSQTVGRTVSPLFAFSLGVVMCHAVAYLIDVYRGEADTRRPIRALLYLVQLPVLLAGPLSRYREFSEQLSRGNVAMGAFAYGVRRVVTGAIKAILVAGTLGVTADAIFSAPPARLSAGAVWLAALCYSLQIYLRFSGYCDIGIGIGRMIGLRYPENFRRPYTADSIREFWRRWNVTLITWLRDYLYLPIAGQDDPTARLYMNIVAGFCIVGLWHRGSQTFLVWGLYYGTWLAFEAIGLRTRIERMPAAARHVYVLLVVIVGWVILRARTLADAWALLKTMAGVHGPALVTATEYLSLPLWIALGIGVFAAGPLVPSVSRWRVSVDAATTSLLMMFAATGVFLWRAPMQALAIYRGSRATISSARRRGAGSRP